jgi:ABC-type polysaccharide/polyol phosphate export permease
MSNWTKGFIGVAILSQIFLFIILFGCKSGNAFYISSVDLFALVICSVNTVVYIYASITSYYNDLGEAYNV